MDSSYTYSSTSTTSASDSLAMIMGLMGYIVVIALVAYVITSFLLGKIFKKAGEESWKAWVPVYNQWVFLELGGQKGWLCLLNFLGAIPFVGWIGSLVAFVFAAIAAHKIGKNFGKDDWWVVLYIFVGLIWMAILAFDDSKWQQAPAGAMPQPMGMPNGAPAYQPPVQPMGTDMSMPQQDQTPAAPQMTPPADSEQTPPPQNPIQ